MITSSFQKTGKLTPDEFVKAGDTLVQKIPSWEWVKGQSNIQPYLPLNKKYLILKFCYSKERVSTLYNTINESVSNDTDWIITEIGDLGNKKKDFNNIVVGDSDSDDDTSNAINKKSS